MANKTNKYIEFLDRPLPGFKTTPPPFVQLERDQDDSPKPTNSTYLKVPSARNDTTSQWRIDVLKFTVLQDNQYPLEELCAALRKATRTLSQTWVPPTLYDELCCRFSRVEDDIVCIIWTYIVEPIFHMITHPANARKWIPSSGHHTRALKYHGELIGESYAKDPLNKLPGVRVDKIFVLTASKTDNTYFSSTRQGSKDMEELFSSDASQVKGKTINSKHEYLRWGQNWASFKWDGMEDVQKTCKALLPIEVKNAGALNENIFVWLAKHQVMLGQSGDNVLRDELADDWLSLDSEPESSTRSVSEEATLRAIKGTISMIGQVIRYGIHYGVTYVILTDYEHGVVFEIPAGLHTYQTKSHKDKEQPPETVQWTFVHKDKLRWAVAAAVWNACQAITLSMEDLEENLP